METLFVLIFYINGVVKEYMGYWENPVTREWTTLQLSGCLAMKRTLRDKGFHSSGKSKTGNTRYACEKHTVETRLNYEGNKVIARIIYDN